MRLLRHAALVLLLAGIPGAARSAPVRPAETPAPSTEVRSLALEAGTGRVLALASPAANVFVADPKVAEVRPASASALFVFGVAAGHTTVAALDANGRVLAQYDVTVQPTAFAAHQAEAVIAHLVAGSRVKVQSQPKGLLLTGAVASPADAAQAAAVARGFLGENQAVDNELSIDSPIQVTLHVRIAEMSRQVVRNLGVNWSALGNIGSIAGTPALSWNVNGNTLSCGNSSGGSVGLCPGANFNGVIDALAKDNLAHVLAEPNLTVMSGEAASFQVGGEYPIPVSQQNNQITVSYKNFGVMLSFVPTVYNDGRINLHVRPEVSELSSQNSVSMTSGSSTLVVPALTVRRAETTVELGSGQSFAIAGLLQQSGSDSGNHIPGLGDTPLLGALFRDNQFQNTEKELVIVVTPYVVRPVNNQAALHLPTDGFTHAPDLERLLLMRQAAHNAPPVPVRIPGDAGFIVQ